MTLAPPASHSHLCHSSARHWSYMQCCSAFLLPGSVRRRSRPLPAEHRVARARRTRARPGKYPARATKAYSIRSGTRFMPGATWTATGVNFSVFSQKANRVELLLYEAADSAEPFQIIVLDPEANRSYFFWHVFVEGLPAGTCYTWRVDAGKELVDPWARSVTDAAWIRQ